MYLPLASQIARHGPHFLDPQAKMVNNSIRCLADIFSEISLSLCIVKPPEFFRLDIYCSMKLKISLEINCFLPIL